MPGALCAAVARRQAPTAEPDRMASPPQPLTLERNRDLAGLYTGGLIFRRIGFAVLLAMSVLGLLNVFGQRSSSTTADASAARLELSVPSHLRGGLLFMARFRITAKQDLQNATLVLAPGWTEDMTINTIEPSPTNETSENGLLTLELGQIKAGATFVLYMEFQVNPTNVGRRSQDVELRDGDTHIATIERTMRVYP
jgi:hypothetical protein